MKHFATLLALPTSLLSIVAIHAQELPWPYNLPRTVKYYPQDEAHVKRELAVQERLQWQVPAGVRKMPIDDGEKFYFGYWAFEDELDDASKTPNYAPDDLDHCTNASMTPALHPAIAQHSKRDVRPFRMLGRSIFQRDFQCPSGTHDCSSIGQNNLCCDNGETCVSTSDGVGCCPAGATCGNNVSDCDTAAGYTSCPNSPNGGCCIPGAVCKGVGCVFQGTETVTRTASLVTQTTGVSYATETSSGKTITVEVPVTEVSVSTLTVTESPNGYTTTKTLIISGTTTQSCRNGYFLCPQSDGGGCCPNGQACGADGSCPDATTSTTATANQPVLPTSISPASVSSSPTTTITTSQEYCPVGYYQCSARYLGGCCQVGRNCETTSCPPQDSTTLVSSGVTIVVTSPANAEATTGSCANGWFLCGATGGGGCCPSGYLCGQVSCTATNQGQQNTLKMAPSSASIVGWAWSFLVLALFAAAGMIML